MRPSRFQRDQLIISCEHASNLLPARYGNLGLGRRALESHIAWDRGARSIARHCARRLACSYHEGRYSRLLIDLNRSPHHAKLIPKVAFGVQVPGNTELSEAERRARIVEYYQPYRERLLDDLRRAIRSSGACLHFAVHTFAPRVGRSARRADIGVLYDPGRLREKQTAQALAAWYRRQGLSTRCNYPYRGTSDGITAFCRRHFTGDRYLGIEIEVNQRLLRRSASRRTPKRIVAAGLEALLTGEV
ncbi:MAG: N-formylglutamate amidohydrolase [Gemmatimonadota bacterium]|nr:MAG: N-formylglutamate amidohydrolase [Gemmatimonadota bacterium]